MEYKQDELQENQKNKLFRPSKKEVETVQRVYQRFLDMQQERDKPRRYFDWMT